MFGKFEALNITPRGVLLHYRRKEIRAISIEDINNLQVTFELLDISQQVPFENMIFYVIFWLFSVLLDSLKGVACFENFKNQYSIR